MIVTGRKRFESLGDVDEFTSALQANPTFATVVENAAEQVTTFEGAIGNVSPEAVRNFLRSPEVEAIVRQVFASKLSEQAQESTEMIREEFEATVRLKFGLGASQNKPASQLFDTLLAGCERSLEIAIDQGVLAAHEAKSSFRYRMLRDELATVRKNTDLLTQSHAPDVPKILAFEEQYRHLVSDRFDSLTPPYVDTLRRVPINDLYVAPRFLGTVTEEREVSQYTESELLSHLYRAVVLGNPGGGKSTFAQKISYDLSTHYEERQFAGRELTPILVVLRDYGAAKSKKDYSIPQFIEARTRSEYQISPPPYAFEYLLLNGRAVVIFDGLDELLDTKRRQEITQAVESFCKVYPAVPVLVTSREVGYEQAPLDDRKFETFRLSDFSEEQVSDYVAKWFAANADLLPEQQSRETAAFLSESRIVPDLRANPLMLGLMCNIYRGENYIPRNRPDVYKKCAEMLFERWDRSRDIHYSLPFEAHIKPAMTYLANWIYSDEALQGGVTEDQLVEKATEYLHPDQFEDRDEAALAAREFVQYCRGRAWVFTEIGLTALGDRLYQFTHRTFLEYFTALYLTRTHYVPDKLFQVLLPRIASREWDIVAQLAFQIQSDAAAGAGDELLSALLNSAEEFEENQSWNCISFAARCLEFLVPSASVRSQIARSCLLHSRDWALKRLQEKEARRDRSLKFSEDSPARAAMVSLAEAGPENRNTVARTIEELLTQWIVDGSEEEAVSSIDIAAMLPSLAHEAMRDHHSDDARIEVWYSVNQRIFSDCSETLEMLAPKYFAVCFDATMRGIVSIENFVEWHGIADVFEPRRYLLSENIRVVPMGVLLLIDSLRSVDSLNTPSPELKVGVDSVKQVGRLALTHQTPWVDEDSLDIGHYWTFLRDEEDIEPSTNDEKLVATPDAEILFGIFTLLALFVEAPQNVGVKTRPAAHWMRHVKNSQRWIFANFLRQTFVARFEEVSKEVVQSELDKCQFTAEQQSFVRRWISEEISFVGETLPY